MVAPAHNFDPKIIAGKTKALDVGGPSSIDFIVERLYCKRPIQCLASSKILTPTPTRLWCGGGHTRWEERGGVNILEDARHRSVLYCTYVSTLWILYIFGGRIRSSEAAMDGGGGRAAPRLRWQ
jgi:hypothetical protein